MKNYQIPFLVLILLVFVVSCNKSVDHNQTKSTLEKVLEKGEDFSLADSVRVQYVDSAYSAYSTIDKNDSVGRYFFRRMAAAYYNSNAYDKSIKVSRKIFSMAAEAKDTASMAKALYVSGTSYSEKNNNDSAFIYYKEAENLYNDLNDLESLASITLYKAYIYFNIGEYVLSESEGIKALRLLREQNRSAEVYQCYNLIGTALDGQNNNEEAIKYFQLALDELAKFKDQGYTDEVINQYKASCYNNMGLVYIKMKSYDKAVSIYKEALGYTDIQTTNPALYARLLNNYASSKLKKGDYAELPNLFLKALGIRENEGEKSDIVASYYNLGEYYVARKDTITALKYLKLSYKGAKELESSFDIKNSLKLLSEVDKKNVGYFSSLYIQVTDSLAEKAKADKNRFARIAYETDRLESEKQELTRKNNFIVGVSVVVLLFLAAIFMIYYLNSRNKKLILIQEQQRANEEIYQLMFEQQSKVDTARAEEKTRIAMELHDGILNNIYAVRLNLEFTNRKTDQESIDKRKGFIKELQLVEGEIRAVSHELSRNVIFEQNQSFESILGFMVTSQKNTFGTEFEALIDREIDWENIPNTSKINVYRIIQEALQNINKYAEARHAIVNVIQEKQTIKIMVTDDGTGFDTTKAADGIGLKNLKKRTEALNGTITIESEPGHGTVIMVHFSL